MSKLTRNDAFNYVEIALDMLQSIIEDDIFEPPLSTDLSYVVVRLRSVKDKIDVIR